MWHFRKVLQVFHQFSSQTLCATDPILSDPSPLTGEPLQYT